GQALPGETIEAKGVLEETAQGLRLVVGTTREARGEWIRSLTLLEN
ncbi:MAG: DNA polymerase subunit beta, partial [Methanothrix sp.]